MRHRMSPVTLRIGAALAITLLCVACSGGDDPTDAESESAEPTASAADETAEATESEGDGGTTTSVFDLEVGDCYDGATEANVETVDVVDCDTPHEYEVYALVQHEAGPGEEYPGDEAISDFADDACLGSSFEDYVGRSYQDSELYAFALQPTAETWDVGDREVVCAAFLQNEQLEGSVEGSDR